MNRRKKYRFFVICCLALDLLVMLLLGYQYLDRKIPDEIQISRDSGENAEDVTEVLSTPLVTFEEAVTVSQDGGYILPCKLLGYIPFKDIKVTPVDDQEVYVSGSTIGIYMETEGVLVIDTGEIQDQNGETKEPAKNIIRQGDYIVSFNGHKISTKKELISDIAELDGTAVTLEVSREGESIPVSVTPVKDTKGDYKLGIWVRDDTQGIGTLTYVDQNGNYGALGHGISDIDTTQLLNIGNLKVTVINLQNSLVFRCGIIASHIFIKLIYQFASNLTGSIYIDNSAVICSGMPECHIETSPSLASKDAGIASNIQRAAVRLYRNLCITITRINIEIFKCHLTIGVHHLNKSIKVVSFKCTVHKLGGRSL